MQIEGEHNKPKHICTYTTHHTRAFLYTNTRGRALTRTTNSHTTTINANRIVTYSDFSEINAVK